MTTLIETAHVLANKAHDGQFRRDKVTPYIIHPLAVYQRLKGESDEVLAVALLHDTAEADAEHPISFATLRATFPEAVANAVLVLTHSAGRDYESYLYDVRANPIARKVKIADMLSNLADSPTDKQIVKYARGLLILMEP